MTDEFGFEVGPGEIYEDRLEQLLDRLELQEAGEQLDEAAYEAPATAGPRYYWSGDQGAASQWVRWVQNCLAQLVGPWVPQTGIMGRATRRAIGIFQAQQQLPATGLLDNDTVNALQAARTPQAVAPQPSLGEVSPQTPAETYYSLRTPLIDTESSLEYDVADPAAQQYTEIVRQLRKELERRFTDPNDPGLYERRLRLRRLFSSVPRSYAKVLHDRLGERPREDALSKSFHGTLSRETRRELLGILNRIPPPAVTSPVPSRATPSLAPPQPAPSPAPQLVWPTSPLPPSEAGRFVSALNKLEARVKSTPDPRNWRYQCWFQKLRNSNVDDRVIRWSKICPAISGAIGAAYVVGPCDISMGYPVAQEKIEKGVRSVADVDTVGQSLGIITYLKSDIVVSEEMTSLPLENLRMLHDDVQRAIDKLRNWADSPMGGSSAMPTAYVSIKDWIGGRQRDPKSVYSCL